MAMQGQTIRRYESNGWWKALSQGSVLRTHDSSKRTGRYYMQFDDGIGNLFNFDYVNGFTYGPDLTLGYVDSHYGRWEVCPELRYGNRRDVWSGALDVRYVLPPAYFSWLDLFFLRGSVDYDQDAYATLSTNGMATTLAGWNGYKLLEAERIGCKGSLAVGSDFQLEGGAWHERRWQLRNHRQRNIFRVKGQDNLPRMRGVALDDVRHQWGYQQLWRLDAALEYTPNRRLMCYHDMRTEVLPGSPVFRLSAQSGWGDVDYLSLSLSASQEIGDGRQAFRYVAAGGCYPVGHDEVWLMDMHHFDASHMAFQRKDNLTWFSLLSNYEMSSANEWAEMHVEWNSCRMLLTQLTDDPSLKEYLQCHFATVEGYRQHTELCYGFDLAGQMRIGCSFGWDGSHFDGVGLNFLLLTF